MSTLIFFKKLPENISRNFLQKSLLSFSKQLKNKKKMMDDAYALPMMFFFKVFYYCCRSIVTVQKLNSQTKTCSFNRFHGAANICFHKRRKWMARDVKSNAFALTMSSPITFAGIFSTSQIIFFFNMDYFFYVFITLLFTLFC